MVIVTSSFTKSFVLKKFSVHTKTQSWRFQIPTVTRAFSEKLRFRDGLEWTEGLTV